MIQLSQDVERKLKIQHDKEVDILAQCGLDLQYQENQEKRSVRRLHEKYNPLTHAIYPISFCDIKLVESLLRVGANPNAVWLEGSHVLDDLLTSRDTYPNVVLLLRILIRYGISIGEDDIAFDNKRFHRTPLRRLVDQHIRSTIIDVVLAMWPLGFPVYHMFFILEFLPQFFRHSPRHKTIALLESVFASIERVQQEKRRGNVVQEKRQRHQYDLRPRLLVKQPKKQK